MYAPGTEHRVTRLTATSVLNMVASLLRPLFLATRLNGHTFSCEKPSLMRSLVNTAKLFCPIGDCINEVPLSVQCLCMVSLERPEIIDL